MLAWLATGGILGGLTVLAIAMLRRSKSKAQLAALRGEIEQLGQALHDRAFHRLLQTKETLEATLAALPDLVLVVDADARVVVANARAERLLRARSGVVLDDLPVPGEVKEAIRACLHGRNTDATAVDLQRAVTLVASEGPRRLLPRVTPIRGPGEEVSGAVLVLSDVSELSRLDSLRSELVGIASHELRTPLTTLRMTLLMLEEEARLGSRDREILATALGGVDQLSATVDEFLDLTRVESGQLKLNRDLVPIRSLIEGAADRTHTACRDAGINLVVEVDKGAPATAEADAARLGAVLRNLLSNAVKYTPSGGEIRLSVRGIPTSDSLEIQVTDTGPGVPAEYRERIFEKFFQVEDAIGPPGRMAQGSGIGLYLSRQVVTAHGGELVCTAGPAGRGAQFTLRIPLRH